MEQLEIVGRRGAEARRPCRRPPRAPRGLGHRHRRGRVVVGLARGRGRGGGATFCPAVKISLEELTGCVRKNMTFKIILTVKKQLKNRFKTHK